MLFHNFVYHNYLKFVPNTYYSSHSSLYPVLHRPPSIRLNAARYIFDLWWSKAISRRSRINLLHQYDSLLSLSPLASLWFLASFLFCPWKHFFSQGYYQQAVESTKYVHIHNICICINIHTCIHTKKNIHINFKMLKKEKISFVQIISGSCKRPNKCE